MVGAQGPERGEAVEAEAVWAEEVEAAQRHDDHEERALRGRGHALLRLRVGRSLRGKRSHTRNQHLGNHRGLSVAFSNGSSAAFSNELSCL